MTDLSNVDPRLQRRAGIANVLQGLAAGQGTNPFGRLAAAIASGVIGQGVDEELSQVQTRQNQAVSRELAQRLGSPDFARDPNQVLAQLLARQQAAQPPTVVSGAEQPDPEAAQGQQAFQAALARLAGSGDQGGAGTDALLAGLIGAAGGGGGGLGFRRASGGAAAPGAAGAAPQAPGAARGLPAGAQNLATFRNLLNAGFSPAGAEAEIARLQRLTAGPGREFQEVEGVGLVELPTQPGQEPRVVIAEGDDDTTTFQREFEFLRSQGFSDQQALDRLRPGPQRQNIYVGPQGQNFGDPPNDHVWRLNPDGTVFVDDQGRPSAVVIPGTETARELAAGGRQSVQRREQAQTQANIVVQDLDRVLELARSDVITGIPGQALSFLPGTAAADAEALLTTVRANIGFDRLRQMREASPTGGALGNVTIGEIERLEATLGNLSLAQSQDQFLRNARRARRQFATILQKIPDPTVVFGEGTAPTVNIEQPGEGGQETETPSRVIEFDAQGNRIQ